MADDGTLAFSRGEITLQRAEMAKEEGEKNLSPDETQEKNFLKRLN